MNPTLSICALWKHGYFTNSKAVSEINSKLSVDGHNFPKTSLMSALTRASYLIKIKDNGVTKYIQRNPYTNETEHFSLGAADFKLHASIQKVAWTKYRDEHYADAVEAAFKEIIKRVKDFVNPKIDQKLEGDRLMNRAFGCESADPIIKFNSVSSDEEKDEQKGIMFLFKGIVGIRNRKAHENITLDNPKRAWEYLMLGSLLMNLLDEFMK